MNKVDIWKGMAVGLILAIRVLVEKFFEKKQLKKEIL